jgi:hypothetical protein
MQQSTLFTLIKNNDLTFSLVSSENRKFVGSIDVNRFPMEVFYPTNSERVHFFIELVHNFDWNEKDIFLQIIAYNSTVRTFCKASLVDLVTRIKADISTVA